MDPLYVDFYIPEQALPKIVIGQKISLKIESDTDDLFEGEITSINSKIDEATRNVLVRATFKNPDHKLMPGMFGRLIIQVGEPKRFITLPQTAVVFNPYGTTVFLVHKKDSDKDSDKDGDESKETLTVQQSVITTGDTRGDQITILSGIQEGDEVVTSGQVKLRNGASIVVNNDVQPSNDPNPQPHDH